MIGAHQNFNGSRYLTAPSSRMICHPWLALATVNPPTKFELSTNEKQYKISK